MAKAISATVSMTSSDWKSRCAMKKAWGVALKKPAAGAAVSRSGRPRPPGKTAPGSGQHDVAQVEHVVGALDDLDVVLHAPGHGLLVQRQVAVLGAHDAEGFLIIALRLAWSVSVPIWVISSSTFLLQ